MGQGTENIIRYFSAFVHQQLAAIAFWKGKFGYPLIRQYGLIEQSSKYTLDNLKHSWLPQVNLSAQATYQSETPSFPDQMKTMLAFMKKEVTEHISVTSFFIVRMGYGQFLPSTLSINAVTSLMSTMPLL